MKPIDLRRLRDFSDGTESGLRDLAALLVTHMEDCLHGIRRGVAERDDEAIRSEAHRGAGTFGACGAGPLTVLLLELQGLGGARSVEGASALLPAITREVERVRQFLEATFSAEGTRDHATRVEQ